ncbi:hypothetical protein DID75_03185 [Candidatus Marinamargulisbacteria bacterium SCGC AG-410-N11]|nr:hypothetical protein DID75_03185 [Candidatus Marinamargulisbacteria bacterium SCGC AG-410-N11]
MKILITGGAGYIGSVLVNECIKLNYDITVIDTFKYSQTSLLHCCNYPKLRLIKGDCRDKELIKNELQKADCIIPLACLVGAPLCESQPFEAASINRDSIFLILDFLSKSQKLIFPCTNSGYGIGKDNIFCTETSDLNPISTYGKLKVEAEKRIIDNGNGITLRLATVFGVSPRMRLDLLVNDFTYKALREKSIVLFESHFKRNYIHIQDVVQCFIHCLNNYEKMNNETYNLGLSNANLSKKELCHEIEKIIGPFEIIETHGKKDPDQRNYIVSNEKIENTGFKASTSLEIGIKELVRAYTALHPIPFRNY